jgi:hypothetical protein
MTAASGAESAFRNRQSAICNPQSQSAIRNLQSAISIRNLQSAICNLQSVISDMISPALDDSERQVPP